MRNKIPFIILCILYIAGCDLLQGNNSKPAIPGKIAFSTPDKDGRYQIFVSNTDGSNKKQLTHFDDNEAFSPSWSNDGTKIAFTTTLRSSSAGASLYLMNADGSNVRPLKERPNSHIVTPGNNPEWSNDDSKIAFDWCTNCELGGNNYEIYVYDFETDEVAQLTSNSSADNFPTWSPNDNFLAFTSNRDYVNSDTLRFRKDLYQINLNSLNEVRLTNSGNATNPVWTKLEDIILFEWNIGENTLYSYKNNLEIVEKITLGLQFAGAIQFSSHGNRAVVYGRETVASVPEIRFYDFKEENLIFLNKQKLNGALQSARNFDWIFNEN